MLALEDGFELNYASFILEKDDKKHIRDTKKRCANEANHNALEEIELLSETEIERLGNKPRKTLKETLSFERHKLIDFYKINHNDESSLKIIHELDNSGRLRKKINLLELALSNKDEAKKLFEAQYKEQSLFRADVHNYATEQMFYQKVLEELKIVYIDNKLTASNETYNKKSLLQSQLFAWIKENHQILSGVISLPSWQQIVSEPLRFISKLLEKLSLKQKRVGKCTNNNYSIEVDQVNFISSILSKRKAIKGNTSSNYCLYNAASVLEELLPTKRTKLTEKVVTTYDNLIKRTKDLLKSSVSKIKNNQELAF